MKRFLMVCALLAGFASAATAQEFGSVYRSATIAQEGDQVVWSSTLSGDQSSDIASRAVTALTEFAHQANDGQHLVSAGWAQSAPGKPYGLRVVMSSAAQTKPVLPAMAKELTLITNCAVNSHLQLKADPALVAKFKAMDSAQIIKLVQSDEKDMKDDEKAMRQLCVRMTQLAAYAHSFPIGATAKQISVKTSKTDQIEFEVVFLQKYADEKKIQAATISAIQSSAPAQFIPQKSLGI